MDPEAYDYVLSSEIAIYLIPCVQGFKDGVFTVGNDCSYFVAQHSDLLRDCDDEILKWFVYERNHAKENFEEYELTSNECERFLDERRNLWCSSILPHIVNDNYEHDFESYRAEKKIEFPYYFKHDKTKDNIYRFKIKNRDEYINYSIWLINHILKI